MDKAQGLADYKQLEEKRVILQHQPKGEDDSVEERPGTLEAVNDLGILFKAKGRSSSELIMWFDVVGIEADDTATAPKSPAKIKPKRVNPVASGAAKRHLADAHGLPLSYVNQLTADQAVQVHDKLHEDDAANEISHYHAEKPAEDAAA
jgi:hypothetical protein